MRGVSGNTQSDGFDSKFKSWRIEYPLPGEGGGDAKPS